LVGLSKFEKEIVSLNKDDVGSISVYVDGQSVTPFQIFPTEGLVQLRTAPPSGSLVKIAYYSLHLAHVGAYGVEIVSDTTFMVDPLLYRAPFPISTSNFRRAKIYFNEELGSDIFTDLTVRVDDVDVDSSKYEIDESLRTITFKEKQSGINLSIVQASTDETLQSGFDYFVIKRVSNELLKRKTTGTESILDLEFSKTVAGTLEVWLDEEKLFNYTDENTDVYSKDKITFSLVDGYKVTFSKKLPPGLRVTASYYYLSESPGLTVPIAEVFDDSWRIMLPDAGIVAKSVDVWVKKDIISHEVFTFDSDTNDLIFNEAIPEGEVKVSYYYALDSQGPYEFSAYGANNEAIEGCVLSFAKQAQVGGRQLVFISGDPEPTSHEYGGKFRVSFTLDIVALDPIQQEEITDLTAMYLLSLKERFDSEGIILDEISIQGEAEEPYDENTTDQYYMASVSVVFLTDWHIRKPIPIKIRDVHLKFISYAYSDIKDVPVFQEPTLFPIIESPILKSERVT